MPIGSFPQDWVQRIEYRDRLARIATELAAR